MKKKELTTNQIIEAAFELFAEHGIERTSLSMIAGKVGITKPSIYYHFSTKEELVSRIYSHLFENHYFDSYFQADLVTAGNFREALYKGGLKMLPDGSKEHAASLRVLSEFMLLAERDEQYRSLLGNMQHNFLNGFHNLLMRGVELGVVAPQNVVYKAHMLALVIDNLSRCMMMKVAMEYHEVWKETVNSVLLETRGNNE
ncbi:transcriptional regulator, TetR family [Paenibacillus algorifonticola]|uniref:Transcriptional regulator, TetR family n=1 Tax=Paenibacillus algorifonticola TaxID=684063 RepID=A0A1I2HNY3_9BACL|nr:TetR/AcrR family transcriptional regulator [Paenibacillus algorifonticola]SFF31402.1 transcriptional regulator, TetR family [Paenibacillus algorifonticola]